MKKIVFTLMIFALVAVSNKMFAQSTYDHPYVGAEQIYKWSAVTANSYYYAVTTSPISPTTSPAVENTDFQVSTGALLGGGTLANASSANLGLTWLTGSETKTFYVWLVATSADGCVNWRYVTVVPEANQVDFVLAALGLYSKTESVANLNTAAAANGGNGCPTPALRDGAVYDSNGATDDGDVYAYFRVSQGANNNDDTWTFAFTASTGAVEYYNGTAWVAYSEALTGIADNAVQLLRVMVATPLATAASATTITGTISAAAEETTGLVDSDANNDEQDFIVNRVAAIGGFSGN